MNVKKFRLINAIMLYILFALTLLSIFLSEHGTSNITINLHVGIGSLLMLASILHLGIHLPWIRNVFSRSKNSLSLETRRNRRVGLSLIFIGLICATSGWMQLVFPPGIWHRIHAASGFLMIMLLFIHMLLHHSWTVNQIRALFSNKSMPKESASGVKTDL